jgi:hypothetical protein
VSEALIVDLFLTTFTVGVLTGIFFRLGRFSAWRDDISRRVENLERKTEE